MSNAGGRKSSKHAQDMLSAWRLECQRLQERCEDLEAEREALKSAYGELSKDYHHALSLVWKANRRQ